MLDTDDFNGFLIARLCHDLTSSISALNHSIEFLDDPNMRTRASELLKRTGVELMHSIRCYRYAYGHYSTEGEADLESVRKIVSQYLSDRKINVIWQQDYTDFYLSHEEGKILVNMILAAAGTMIYGGDICVNLKLQEKKKLIEIKGKGRGVRAQDDFLAILMQQKDVASTPRNVQTQLLSHLAKSRGVELIMDLSVDQISILTYL